MYTQEEYLYGWLIYLVGVIILMGCGWILTAGIPSKEIRHLLRIIAGVTFIVPWYASPDLDALAPAWIIAAFEGIFDGGDAFWRAGTPLLSSLAAAVVISLVLQLISRVRSR